MNNNSTTKLNFISKRANHWDKVAKGVNRSIGKYYHKYLEHIYQFFIPPNLHVLEIGCGNGNLLASLKPAEGVGVDLSEEMVLLARQHHPELKIIHSLGEDIELEGSFDVIILSDMLNDTWDVQELLANLYNFCNESTRIIINSYSRLWQPFLNFVRHFGLATPLLPQNWLTVEDLKNFLYLEGFETIKTSSEILIPLNIPILNNFINRFIAKIFPFKYFCLTNFLVARKAPVQSSPPQKKYVSVIVAARNEAGNIADIFRRVPEMGQGTELIFVEGGSSDNTFEVIEKEIRNNSHKKASVYKQKDVGKGDAVRTGFEKANGEILMILDADLTVPPENLPLFYEALVTGKGEFINGIRLVYPMESEAMRFFNIVGNKFFSLTFSWLLGQPIKDTLCGTKVLTRQNYDKIAKNRSYFGDFDPFGDFDLIFGAAKLNLKIIDLPIRYRNRLYGDTNISRWKHGWILLKMALFASSKIKFF